VANNLEPRRKQLTPEQWLTLGTWVLVGATIFLALDASWTSDRQTRAYVYVNPGDLYHIDGKGALQVYSNIGNSGQTPAINVERFAGIEVLPSNENPLATQPIAREPGVTVLGPRNQITLIKNWGAGALNSDQSEKIQSDDFKVYVFGKVFYDDVTGGRWELDFCNAYSGREIAIHGGDDPRSNSYGYVGWQSKPCEKGNEIKERKFKR
jgi:hypothetical protein